MSLLQVRQLTMRFGGLTAVSQLDLAIEPGQIFSVIGPNGAGKTTAFNAITGIYAPTEGEIFFEGKPQRRTFSRTTGLTMFAIGLAVGVLTLLATVNVDRLWMVAIKSTFVQGDRFSFSAAVSRSVEYLNGEPYLRRDRRGTRWEVVTHGKVGSEEKVLAEVPIERRGAYNAPEQFAAIREAEAHASAIRQKLVDLRDATAPDAEELRTLTAGKATPEDLDILRMQRAHARERAGLAFLIGLGVGMAGFFVTWQRARRSPDFIAGEGIARTFQNIRLFPNMTLLENVLIGMDRRLSGNPFRMALRTPGLRREERAAADKARDLLAFVGLVGRAGDLARNLPYGDQRRLEIARALATYPKLLLLDEPAAGMNPTETADLMELIRRIRERGVTILLIEHHMSLVMGISDRVAVLDHGVKIAEGSPAEVRENPQVIEAYLGKEEVH